MKKDKPPVLNNEHNFTIYLSQNFVQVYLQFRLKYYIHDKMRSPDYRKLKVMWDTFLVGLELAYITGLAKIILPLARIKEGERKGEQRFPNQIAIETWIPKFKIQNTDAEGHLVKWRNKVTGHIEAGMIGKVDKNKMGSLINEAFEAIVTISKSYKPEFDFRAGLEAYAESAENDFLKLLNIIKENQCI